MTYIATFFSHYGAICFKRVMQERGIQVALCPVPRALSSSCGTCARFAAEDFLPPDTPELDRIIVAEDNL